MPTTDHVDYHALAISFDIASEPFDSRHRPMTSGFSHSPDGVHWHAEDPGRPLHDFQEIRLTSKSFFFLRVFTNNVIDDDRPLGLIISARPAIEAVVSGTKHQGPFEPGPNIAFSQQDLPEPVKDVRSPALDGQKFASMWSLGPIPFLPVTTPEAARFELLVELRVRIQGELQDFKVDPELVIRGDSKSPDSAVVST